MKKPEAMTLEKWVKLQETLSDTVKDLDLTEKEAIKLGRFFMAMIKDKTNWGK